MNPVAELWLNQALKSTAVAPACDQATRALGNLTTILPGEAAQ